MRSKDIFQASRRLSEVAKRLRRNLELWNYEEVFLPTLEKLNSELDKGTKFAYADEFYLIKPDLTSQILRHLNDPGRLRLFYLSEVLEGGVEGSWQCGVEFIGGRQLWMQVEVLTVAISCLENLDIKDFYVDIGSIEVWNSVTQGISQYREQVFRALYRRNFELIEELDIEEAVKDRIWELFNLRGKSSDYDKLEKIVEAVDNERVYVDLGTVRPLPYYDDIIFEIYSPQLGTPIGGGGEYRFEGKDAFGFAFDLESILKLSPKNGEKGRKTISGGLKESYRRAKRAVREGVEVDIEGDVSAEESDR